MTTTTSHARKPHIAVIGAGLSGLTAALWATQSGARVTLLTKGLGGLLLSNGSLDVLGYRETKLVSGDPFAALASLPHTHPYSLIGADNLHAGVKAFLHSTDCFTAPKGTNLLSPSPIGAARPTYAIPRSGLTLQDGMKLLVVGLEQFKDFPALLIADNLSRSEHVKVSARAVKVNLPGRGIEADVNTTDYARAFDGPAGAELLRRLANHINTVVHEGEVVLVPAILGLRHSTFESFTYLVHAPVHEVPTTPPSIWGRRLNDHLLEKLQEARVDLRLNAEVKRAVFQAGRVTALAVERAGGTDTLQVDAVIDAAGGFASGNLRRDSWMNFQEVIFNLPLFSVSPPQLPGLHDIDSENRAEIERVLSTGVRVNRLMQPLDEDGDVVASNLHCVGEMLAGGAPWRELAGEGLALGSSWAAVTAAVTAVGLTPPQKPRDLARTESAEQETAK